MKLLKKFFVRQLRIIKWASYPDRCSTVTLMSGIIGKEDEGGYTATPWTMKSSKYVPRLVNSLQFSFPFLHSSCTNSYNRLWLIICRPNISTCASLRALSNKIKRRETSASRPIPNQSIYMLHSPVLALKTGLQEEIGLENSGAMLPETIPKTSWG